MTYPYLQHGVRDVGWEPISFGQDNTIQFRAETCHGHISSGSHEACIPCRVLPSSSKFQMFMMRATEALPSTPWEYLNAEQQLKLMKGMAKTSKELRTKASNIGVPGYLSNDFTSSIMQKDPMRFPSGKSASIAE